MKIAVLSGGLSAERDVSIATGVMVSKSLREKGHKAVLLDVFFGYKADISHIFDEEYDFDIQASNIKEQVPDIDKIKSIREEGDTCFFGENVIEICKKSDIVFMALHGDNGENGKLQATFDVLGIKYTGTGYIGSALALNKSLSKQLFNANGIATPECSFFNNRDKAIDSLEKEISFPCVVKPCSGGSSIGVSIAHNREEYLKAIDFAFKYEENIMIERFIKGREFSVGVLGGKSLPIIEIKPKSGFYDYVNKYQKGRVDDICPADLDARLTARMQEMALKVFGVLKLETYARMDFILGEGNEIYCLEANTLPGMTLTSLLPQEAAVVGLTHGDLCEQIIEESLLRYKESERNMDGSLQYRIEDMKGEKNTSMKPISLKQAAEACGGRVYGDASQIISGVAINSKKVEEGFLFIALKGNNVDGHEFIPDAYANGAICCVSEREIETGGKPYILVKSCVQAIRDIAEYYRSLFNVKIIGITGSVGKTTTKEMIYSVLSQRYKVLKTQGNLNNELGVPLTLFRLRDYHEVAIIEMGISAFGEMRNLSKMVRPDVCIITNIGDSHLEFLGDRKGVLKAKSEILDYMVTGGRVYLNGDDELLRTLENRVTSPIFYGAEAGRMRRIGGVYPEHITNMGIKGIKCDICRGDEKIDVMIPAFGQHMIMNALAAVAIGMDLGVNLVAIRRGIESFMPVNSRVNIVNTDSITIIDDSYNANPTSVKAAVDALAELEERKVCILGDMKELGDKSPEMHTEIGMYAAASGIDIIICAGDMAKYISQGAIHSAKKCAVHYFTSVEILNNNIPMLISEGDVILVKASRSMTFESIVERLRHWK